MVVLLFSWSASGGSQAAPGLTAAFALKSQTVTLHEPVAIELSLHNQLAEEVTIELGYNREGNFQFKIIQPDGSSVSPPPLPRHEGITRHQELSMSVGEVCEQQVILSKWYPFSKPGNYRIDVTLKAVVRRGSAAPARIEFSQQLALKVGEHDPNRLKQVCTTLANDGMSSNAETALDAAELLSYVRDVIAVPYLARLTREGPFLPVTKAIAFDGLVRIAKAEGPRNVMSHLGPEDRELKRRLETWFGSPPP